MKNIAQQVPIVTHL